MKQTDFENRFTELTKNIIYLELLGSVKESVDTVLTDAMLELWKLGQQYILKRILGVRVIDSCLKVASLSTSILHNFRPEVSHSDIVQKMVDLVIKKNHDYAGERDPLLNLRMCEHAGVPAWVGISAVRMADKYSRIKNFFETEVLKVASESVEDTLVDLANYSLLCILAFEDEVTEIPKMKLSEAVSVRVGGASGGHSA